MNIELENKIKGVIEQLKTMSVYDIDFQKMDPVAKLMFVALVGEIQKIEDEIKKLENRMIERYCTYFIPRKMIEATPAITLIQPQFRLNKDTKSVKIEKGVSFTFKTATEKQLNYVPLFRTEIYPYSKLINPCKIVRQAWLDYIKTNATHSNKLWVGITTDAEIENLNGLTMLIKGTSGVYPEHIYVGASQRELDFATISEMERINMLSPFDTQQASGTFFSFVENWKDCLLNMDNALWLCVTDKEGGRDRFKKRDIPRSLLQWLENNTLKEFEPNTLWLQIDFPEGFVVPVDCEIQLNVIPVVNIDVRSITLTQSMPIAKLEGNDDSFFLSVLHADNDFIIRDFDANCFNSGDLYRDVRNLYNRFVDDYYAFVEFNEIRDGETLKQLRDAINKIGNTTAKKPNQKYMVDSGTYAMKNMRHDASTTTSVIVKYLVTQGSKGNEPKMGQTLENKKLPLFEQEVKVMVSAMCGKDKASIDDRHELLRYYTLTNDRLYTKKDIEAFLRKEMAVFGKEEWKRITPKMSIEGAGGTVTLQRGLYIDIEFKDKKNYDKAMSMHFDTLMQQRIRDKSCIPMPIIVTLKNLEK